MAFKLIKSSISQIRLWLFLREGGSERQREEERGKRSKTRDARPPLKKKKTKREMNGRSPDEK